MDEKRCPECSGASNENPGEKKEDARPLNVIDMKAIVVKVLWGTGAVMICGGLGALSAGATKPATGLLGLGTVLFCASYVIDWWT